MDKVFLQICANRDVVVRCLIPALEAEKEAVLTRVAGYCHPGSVVVDDELVKFEMDCCLLGAIIEEQSVLLSRLRVYA